MGDPVPMRSPSGRRSRRSVAVDIAIVAAAFVMAAMLVPASILLSFAVLLAGGAAIGLHGASDRRPIAFGSMAGGLVVYGWIVLRGPPTDLSSALRNGLASALLLALILGGALVVPGYLFGRAFRSSREEQVLKSDDEVDDRAQAAAGPTVRSDVSFGVLILVGFAAAIVYVMLHPLGP